MIEKHKVSIVSIMLFLLACSSIFSQNESIDSLKNVVQIGKNDTVMVSTLNALSIAFIQSDQLSEAVEYSDKAIILSEELNFGKGKAYALKNKGLAEYYHGNYVEVLNNWTESLSAFNAIKDSTGIANLLALLGVVYYDQGSHDKALEYYLSSLAISEKINDPDRIVTALVNIGGVYGQMKDYDKALSYYQQIENYLDKISITSLHSTYLMGIGEIYSLRGDHKNALLYFDKALLINKESQNYVYNLTMIGKEEFKMGNFEKAIEVLNLAYETNKLSNSLLDEVQILLALGDVYQNNDISMALKAYKEGETLAIKMEMNEELRDIYKGMSSTYELTSDFKNAYAYHKKYLAQKDLLFNIETDDKIRGLQFDFDLEKKQDQIGLLEKESEIQQLNEKRQRNIIYVVVVVLILIFFITLGIFRRYKLIKETNLIIEREKNRSENLLLNILPEETALELKENGKVRAKKFESVTVLFTDFIGFTHYAHNLSPEELVSSVDFYFSKFDEIMEKYGMEKIKTIGDAYMCAGGLPFPTEDHPFKMIQAAFEIAEFIAESKKISGNEITHFDVRIGINTGPIVAGVVGIRKFAYDIWGDTVNVASRMETLSTPGRINISENTYELIKDVCNCEYRGEVEVKNRGMMKMYYVNGIKELV